jgi:hypothetical protein
MRDETTRWSRLRDRHRDRKQRRAWRRERRRVKHVDAHDSATVAESGMMSKGGFFTKR